MHRISKILCSSLFGLFPIANAIHMPFSQHNPVMAHIHVLQNLKDRFMKTELAPTHILSDTINDTVKKLTQTEVYMKRYGFEMDAFPTALREYKTLIDQILAHEKELADTHYFFYHAHKKELIILQDFIKLIDSYMKLIAPRTDFTFMRFKNTLTLPYKNVNEYLDANIDIDDHDSLTRSQMTSVNLALFGNHNFPGECSFYYFLHNQSWLPSTIRDLLNPIFSHYGFDTKYLSELVDLTDYLESPTGNLLQICIPHEMVDDLVYLSYAGGSRYTNVILEEYYDHTKNRHTAIRPLIEHMCKSTDTISDLSIWQARLMFFDPLVDMHPDIKVYRYNTVTPENMAIYQQKLQNIVTRLITDYLKMNVAGTEPLTRLYQYITAYSQL